MAGLSRGRQAADAACSGIQHSPLNQPALLASPLPAMRDFS